MSKYFVTSDVHGYYNELQDALRKAGFDKNNPEHIFVHCGDLLDRGSQPLECLKFVNSLPKKQKILIRGNHEDLLEECLQRGQFYNHDISNGTVDTIIKLATGQNRKNVLLSYAQMIYYGLFSGFCTLVGALPAYQKYMKSLVDYAEVGKYIFVHGWIPCERDDPNPYHARGVRYTFDPNWKKGDWETARWINGMDAWKQGVVIPDKTILCGHWHTSYGHSKIHEQGVEFVKKEDDIAIYDPFEDKGIIALDACTVVSHKVNCVVLEVEGKTSEKTKEG